MSRSMKRIAAWAVMLSLAAFGAVPALADSDHERARQAFERGEIMPLRAVLERVEADYPGEVVEVELEREDGQWRYEIKLLRAGGVLVELKIDARDGTVLGMKGRDPGRGGRYR